jgi:hypothetical protein
MNLFRRAKLLMASGALALGTLAGLTIAASPAHAATSAATFPSGIHYIHPLNPFQVHLGDGIGCSSNNLTVWGWNFYNGQNLTVNFYRSGQKIHDPVSVTASRLGYMDGWFAAAISFPLQEAGIGDFAASVTETDGYTWWATEQIIC